jgi:hypothetical protein
MSDTTEYEIIEYPPVVALDEVAARGLRPMTLVVVGTQLERLCRLFDELGIDYDRDDADTVTDWINGSRIDVPSRTVTTVGGRGCSGLCAQFIFNVDGSFREYGVWV